MLIYRIVLAVWLIVMGIISSFLIAEYRFFRQQTEELEQLKDDYANYIGTLKKLILEQMIAREQSQEIADQKKKGLVDELDKNNFLVVNREPQYLKKQALSFARRHKLEQAVRRLYESDSNLAYELLRSRAYSPVSRRRKLSHDTLHIKVIERERDRLQKEALFIWPIEHSQFWLSSRFGPRKKPDGSWGFHTGIDMAAVRGTLVKAVGSGVVSQATYASGYGKTVLISHNKKFKTRYAHLDEILVKPGQFVRQGDIIGKVGATGFVRKSKRGRDPSHLHFEIYSGGKQVNPFYFLA